MKRRGFLKIVLSFIGITSTSLFAFVNIFKKKRFFMSNEKEIYAIRSPRTPHWVGDGFYVSTLFHASENINEYISPFVMLDYAAPREFPATDQPKGVGEHPHRGFETVTFCYGGGVAHRDSGGGGGVISEGGVQWMTAGRGVVHEEFHSPEFCKTGGTMEMLQLWVNLPKKDKMTTPRYQDIKDELFPRVELNQGKAKLKLMAGELYGEKSPALTFSELTIFDVEFSDETMVEIPLKEGTNTLVVGMREEVELVSGKKLRQKDMAIYKREGEILKVKGNKGSKFVVFNGQPIEEPIVAYGPFVMNTWDEIKEAMHDYQSGKMGHL
jgi:redox-sensitive bicupin YhaK (pirin superfamily)